MELDGQAGSSAIVVAVRWIEQALLGSVATGVAVIAVAIVGASMLTGRMRWRRGASVVLGCFIIFGASSIANGIAGSSQASVAVADAPTVAIAPMAVQPPPDNYDPYAGASFIPRPQSKDAMRDRLSTSGAKAP